MHENERNRGEKTPKKVTKRIDAERGKKKESNTQKLSEDHKRPERERDWPQPTTKSKRERRRRQRIDKRMCIFTPGHDGLFLFVF